MNKEEIKIILNTIPSLRLNDAYEALIEVYHERGERPPLEIDFVSVEDQLNEIDDAVSSIRRQIDV